MWFTMGDDGIKAAKRITQSNDLRVLMGAISYMGGNNLIVANKADVARDLGMSERDVYRSYERLRLAEFIIMSEEDGAEFYYMNPEFIWNRSKSEHIEAIKALKKHRNALTQHTKKSRRKLIENPT